MKKNAKLLTNLLLPLSIVLLTTALSGCNRVRSPGELLFISDGSTLKTARVSSIGARELGSATIPGIPGSYTRSGNTVTVTIPGHDIHDGWWVDLEFSAGTGGTATSGLYQATYVDNDTFTVQDTASGTITNGTLYRNPVTTLAGTYAQSGTTITITVPNHNLPNHSTVELGFTSGSAVDQTAKITMVGADTFTVTSANSATTSGNVNLMIGTNYTIFGIAMHPSGKWVYVTSTYECWQGVPYCWDAGLISRFAVNWITGRLTFEKATRAMDASGTNTPVDLNFSADGNYLYNQDDDLDGVDMWGVDSTTGDLSLLASSATDMTFMHGVGVSADNAHVYNGDSVFTVDTTAPSITMTSTNVGGGDTNVIVGSDMYVADYHGGWYIRVYDLTNPDAPAQIDAISTNADQQAREVAVADNGSRVVSSGWCGLKSFDFDGASLSPASSAGSNEYVGCGGTWLTDSSAIREMYRTVSINHAGNMIATAYFTNDPDVTGGSPPSGYKLISLSSDGSLSLARDYANGYYTRVAKFFQRP